VSDSPRAQERVQASPAPAPAQRRDPGERDHDKREGSAQPSSPAQNARGVTVAAGIGH